MSAFKNQLPHVLTALGLLFLFSLVPVAAAAGVTLKSLLNEAVDYAAAARWPVPGYTLHQASSYDRAEVAADQPGWFGNNDFSQYLRAETNGARVEQVMLDADGPGCIVRFWLTTVKNKKGTLRIYLDGQKEPVLVFPAYDLLAGPLAIPAPWLLAHPGYEPAENGGNTLRLPIPYAKHCKITWEEAGAGPRYYQINYRQYAPGTTVETFSLSGLQQVRPLLTEPANRLTNPPVPVKGKHWDWQPVLSGKSTATFDLPAGPGAIRELSMHLVEGTNLLSPQRLRSLILEIQYDGETTVWCPVSDFFGSGVGVNPLQSWYRTVTAAGDFTCRWVMPYAQSARIRLHNLNDQPLCVPVKLTTGPWTWDEHSLYFHTAWHYDGQLQTPPASEWPALALQGRGVYVGDTLALFNQVPTWYGEGDEKIRIDGETLPSFLGTGMEDYYDFSFAPRGLMQTPFANQVRVDQPLTQGHNVLTRTRNLDGIPFARSLDFKFELIAWRPTHLIYAMTTYWYAESGARASVVPQPESAVLPVPTLAQAIAASAPRHRPGMIEAETLKITGQSGSFPVAAQDMSPFDAERWSGGSQLLGQPQQFGAWVQLSVPRPATPQNLRIYLTQAPDYGVLQFALDKRLTETRFDGYAPNVKPADQPVDLGLVMPGSDDLNLRVFVVDANPQAVGAKYYFGLDGLEFKNP